MLFYFGIDGVNILLDFNCFFNCRNDLAVMFNFFKGQYSPFSIFEPFMANLIPADLVFPQCFFDSFKILTAIDINP